MKTQFTVQGVVSLRNETVALTGSFQGPPVTRGQHGGVVTAGGIIKVEVVGAGGLDRDVVKPGVEIILVKILEGDVHLLNGATLDFS